MKQKKQFRLYDIYRYIVTKEKPNVRGIEEFYSNSDASVLQVNGHTYCSIDESELKLAVSAINKSLNNCAKPGPKKAPEFNCISCAGPNNIEEAFKEAVEVICGGKSCGGMVRTTRCKKGV